MPTEDKLQEFPVHTLPEKVQAIVDDLHKDSNYPRSHIAAALFFAFASAIGRSCVCRFREGWITPPNLYMALVGSPGSYKTHALNFAIEPLAERDQMSLSQYAGELKAYKSTPTDRRGDMPEPRQRVMRDFTMEAVVKILSSNRNGICVCTDELKSWLCSFDKYRKGGGDKENWLSLFTGGYITVNRKSQDEIDSVKHPFVSVIGTIQPGIIPQVFATDLENGFLSRMLFVYDPDDGEAIKWNDDEDLPSMAMERWLAFIGPAMDMGDSYNFNQKDSVCYEFEQDAKSLLVSWQNLMEEESAENKGPYHIALLRKIETYIIRFSLIFQLMEDVDTGHTDNRRIKYSAATKAVRLAAYFMDNLVYTYDLVQAGKSVPIDKYMAFYDALPSEFTSQQALAIGHVMHLSRATIYRCLDVNSNDPYIEKLRHGLYRKKYQ